MKAATETRIQIINDGREIERSVLGATYEFWKLMGQRKGQALMNALRHKAPELYDIISGTDADCFYKDEVIPYTLSELGFTINIFKD